MCDTSDRLKSWATTEMGYRGPWDDMEMSAVCSGPMAKVWDWLVSNCRDKSTVDMIRGNLKLARRRHGISGELSSMSSIGDGTILGEELKAEKGRLVGDLHNVLAKVGRLKVVLEEQGKERQNMDRRKNEKMIKMKEKQQRTALLGLYIKQVNLLIEKLATVAEKLEITVANVKQTSGTGEKIILSGEIVETESGKKVKDAVGEGVKHILGRLAGKQEESRSDVRTRIVDMAGKLPGDLMLSRLIDQSENQSVAIKRKEDVAENDNQEANEEEDRSFISSVRAEVDHFYKKQVESKMACVELETSCNQLKEKLNEMSANEKVEQISRTRREGKISSYRSSIELVREELARMNELSSGRHPLVAEVGDQQEKMKELCDVISHVVGGNSLKSLAEGQFSCSQLMTKTLPSLSEEIQETATSLESVPSNQLSNLRLAPTSMLTSTIVGGSNCSNLVSSGQLQIHRRSSEVIPSGKTAYNQIKEDSVGRLVGLLDQVEKLEREKVTELGQQEVVQVDRLRRCLNSSKEDQERNLLPVLEEADLRRGESAGMVRKVVKLHGEWSKQGAEEVTIKDEEGWGQLEGRSLSQTVDLVRVAAAQFTKSTGGRK